jgi:hypothetical protein
MKLWIVGQVKAFPLWEFQGIFDSKEKAAAARKDYNWFFVPVELNKELPEETIGWEGLEYKD